MNNFKINVDRKVPDSEYIQSKQDFKEVLNRVAAAKTSIWHSTWFYGTVGLASIAIITTVTFLTPSEQRAYDINTTSKRNQITTTQKNEVLAEVKTAGTFSHSTVEKAQVQPFQNVTRDVDKPVQTQKKQGVHPKKTPPAEVSEMPEKSVPTNEVKPVTAVQPVMEPVVEAKAPRPGMPNISGVFNGELSFTSLCEGTVEINEAITVSSFLIQYSSRYGDRSQQIDGNRITPEVCAEIRELGIDQMIFVTNISGHDSAGRRYTVIPMNFTVIME